MSSTLCSTHVDKSCPTKPVIGSLEHVDEMCSMNKTIG